MQDIYQEITRIQQEGEEAVLATVISKKGSAPRDIGTKMLIRKDGSVIGTIGGGAAEYQVLQEAKKVLIGRKPNLLCLDLAEHGALNMICGGSMQIFIEPIVAEATLYIFGRGYIATALAKMASITGMKAILIDHQKKLTDAEMPAAIELIIVGTYKQFFAEQRITDTDLVVITTSSHQEDEEILDLALKTPARYIGMVASRKKIQTIFTHLKAKGLPQDLSRVHAPIGLEINAETPEEIAVSILAEIIKERRT